MCIRHNLNKLIIGLLINLLSVHLIWAKPIASVKTPSENKIFQVCPSCDFKSIKTAVEVASPGSVIQISSGTYFENDIQIKIPLQLIGDNQGKTIIDGQNSNHHIVVINNTSDVTIQNITFKNTGMSYTQELAGIRAIQSKNCLIKNNSFYNTTYAVYFDNSEFCTAEKNKIVGTAIDEVSGGNGIHVWYGGHHTIANNEISGHRDGIYLEFSSDSTIKNNRVHKSLRYGLHFMQSSQTETTNNYFEQSGSGVALMYSRKLKLVNNIFYNNAGPASYGLLIKDVNDSEITNNTVDKNTIGIFMEGSSRSQFNNNLVVRNGWGLRIMGDCESNNFKQNNFIENTFDVTTNSDHSWNNFNENYWSQYNGYDLNKDGVGDNPFRPVSLSSVILERVDASYILIGSFFFTLLDQIERTLPSLIPEPLKDQYPSMKAFQTGAHL